MNIRENTEKLLETTFVAAINRKRYLEQLISESPTQRNKQAYKEACKDCIDYCESLQKHYKREG